MNGFEHDFKIELVKISTINITDCLMAN